MARSFVVKLLSLAIRQPGDMVDYCRHFTQGILNKGQLRSLDFEEEIRYLFGKHFQFASAAVLAHGLPSQLISLSPDGQFNSRGKRDVRRKSILADTSIKQFRVQLDDDSR